MKTIFTENKPIFSLGQVVATPAALNAVPMCEIMESLGRHMSGDWGDVSPNDWAANDRALHNGDRLLSAYIASTGKRFWIITESDRSATTVLLPRDY